MDLKKVFPIFLAFLIFVYPTSAYTFNSIYQDDGTSSHIVEPPSFYWSGSCAMNISLYATASDTGSFTLYNKWYSPNVTMINHGNRNYDNNIVCSKQGYIGSSADYNNFFESRTTTESSASSTATWVNTTYICDPLNDFITYDHTTKTDNYGYYPYGYVLGTGGWCQGGGAGTYPTATAQLNLLINYLQDGYYTPCGSDLEKAGILTASSGTCSSAFFGYTFWYAVPFNSMYAGDVNITINSQNERQQGTCGNMVCSTNKMYLWDTVTNETTSLDSGALPYDVELPNLEPSRDYWLMIGTQCSGDSITSCTLYYNDSDYDISIFAYEPDWICGYWSSCEDNSQVRNCDDTNGRVSSRQEVRNCLSVPTVDLTIGFEDYYIADVYTCQKEWWLLCGTVLDTIEQKYPTGWTVIGDFDSTGTNRANNLQVSQDASTTGSSSLKMWYIPPKPEEPIADSPTSCGNATTGRFPQVQGDYNESLFIAYNVSFDSPYVQMRFDVKKCSEPVVQYDYSSDLFSCGKLCYSGNCSEEPLGRYGIRLTDNYVENYYNQSRYVYGYNKTGGNFTANIQAIDGSYLQQLIDSSGNNASIVTSGYNFYNGSYVNVYAQINAVNRYVCFSVNNSIAGRLLMTTSLKSYTMKLNNITYPSDTMIIRACNTSSTFTLDRFQLINELNSTTSETLLDYYGDAVDQWETNVIDLSNLDLQTGHNYTISVAVNPENVYDSHSHCIYLDNFRGTFTDSALPSCANYCSGLTYYQAEQQGDNCIFTEEEVSPFCVSEVIDNQKDSEDLQQKLQDIVDGNSEDNFTCIGYDLYTYDNGEWNVIENSSYCNQVNEESAIQVTLYDPPLFVQNILVSFGVTQSLYGYVWFFFSLFMLINYIALGIAIGVTVYLKAEEVAGDNSFIPFLSVILMVIIGALFSGFYPLEIGIPIIVVIGLLLWKQMEGIIGNKR